MDPVARSSFASRPDALFTELYHELRQIARAQLRRAAGPGSLATTALVNEAYLRLGGRGDFDFRGQRRFMALCAQAMRQILVDRARVRDADKRSGARLCSTDIDLDSLASQGDRQIEFLLDIDRALVCLASEDPRLGRIAELRFFGGYSVEECAEILGVSTPTVKRDTRLARAYLLRELAVDAPGGEVDE